MPTPLTDLSNGLALEALQKIRKSFTVGPTLDIARPDTIEGFALFGAALEDAYRKGLAKRLIGEVVEEEKRQLYTCKGKGGKYELLGTVTPAGTLRDVFAPGTLVVYRDTKTGAQWARTMEDFEERMEKLP